MFLNFKFCPLFLGYRRRRSPSRNRKFVVVPSSPVWQRSNDMHLCTSPTENAVIYLEPTDNMSSPSTESCQSTTVDSSDLQSNTGFYQHSVGHIDSPFSGQEDQTVPGFMDKDNEDYLLPLVIETASSLKPSMYQSPLLPAENKPLEANVLRRAKEVLVDADIKTMAMHITKIDCMVGIAWYTILYSLHGQTYVGIPVRFHRRQIHLLTSWCVKQLGTYFLLQTV